MRGQKQRLSCRMKQIREFTGFAEVAKPYYLRYGTVNAFNNIRE